MKKSVSRKSTKKRKSSTSQQSKTVSKSTTKTTQAASGIQGRRKGKKRSDLRFIAPDGSEWASPLEYRVYHTLRASGYQVRRTSPSDALSYTTPVKQGRCKVCNACEVVQDRTYTPDLHIDYEGAQEGGFYLEVKGYFAGPKRNLFRAARQSNPQADVRLVASSDHWVTKGKTRLSDWAKRFKIPFHVWNGKLPQEWL